jgi:hypothetical protein
MFMGGMTVPENINLCLWEAWPCPVTLIDAYETTWYFFKTFKMVFYL